MSELSVPAGEPVLAKLELQNSGKAPAEYDPQTYAPFRVVKVSDTNSNPAWFIGPTPQTSSSPETLAPGQSVTLWDNVDLSELYLLDQGTYDASVVPQDVDRNAVSASNSVRFKIAGGALPKNLQFMITLRDFAPPKWGVSAGFGAIYLSHAPTNLKRDVTTIQLWFTDDPLPANFKLGDEDVPFTVTTIAHTEFGFLHMAAPTKANELWADHAIMIQTAAARVLNFKVQAQQAGQPNRPTPNDRRY
jgi:hypothetical protein